MGSVPRLRRVSSAQPSFGARSSASPGTELVEASPQGDDAHSLSSDSDTGRHRHDDETAVEGPPLLDPDDLSSDALSQQMLANVDRTDDTSLSINTPRMWTLALLAALIQSSMNLLFSLRYPSITLTPIVALLVAHPVGLLWDRIFKRLDDPVPVFADGELVSLSRHNDTDGLSLRDTGGGLHDAGHAQTSSRRTLRLWLGQGHWNKKEHACVFVSSNISYMFAFATDVIAEQVKFYGQDASILYQILLVLSTQLIGYSLAGIFSSFLVRPSAMIWPSNLVSTSLFKTIHSRENKPANGWRISRWDFFVYVFTGSFIWYFLPGLLMPTLSYFNVITWFAPSSVVVSSLFGVSSGLGMFPMTFDWSQIAYTGSPLVTPLFAAMNVLGGLLVLWTSAAILYYTGAFNSWYLPILSASVFDNKGEVYDISKILTPEFLFNSEAYHEYSSVYLPMTYALSYAVQFASMTSLITHTACHHGAELVLQFKAAVGRNQSFWSPDPPAEIVENEPLLTEDTRKPNGTAREPLDGHEDVHGKMMSRYKEVPIGWYLGTGCLTTVIAMFVVEYYPIHLPWWSVLLALSMSMLLFVPIGIVMAITNLQISIYLISQILAGVVFPGRGIANVIFATYAYITSTQGLKFTADLKLGHYMKIPPRILFKVQLTATIISSLSQIGVLNWAFTNISGICTPDAVNGFTCPIARVHFNGSVLWGVIGPDRFFGAHALYQPLVWAFVVGAIAPVAAWLMSRREGASPVWKQIHFPAVFGSLSWIPPATGLNFSVWALVCIIFNHFIRRRKKEWWMKYNMVLSAGLDAGTAVSVLVIFFAIVYWGFTQGLSWWGTEIYKQASTAGCDWKGCAYKNLAPGEHFGPDEWK